MRTVIYWLSCWFFIPRKESLLVCVIDILGDPGAASRDDGIFMGESLQQERESPWALTLTERVPEAFEIPPSDWPEKYFSGQSTKRNSRATLMSCYTRLFSSSNSRSSVARSAGTFLRRASEKINTIINKRSRGNRKL